jgi:hypothetical protein
MVELNGKTYEDWKEYIADKFPGSDFIATEITDTSNTNIITIKSKKGNSETEIVFDFPTPSLCRITFYNPKSPLHNSENDKERKRALMYDDFTITNENVKNSDDYLNIPLYFGWTEEAVYYKDALVISEARFYEGGTWNIIWSENKLSWSNKAGCLVNLLAWPILIPQHKFIYKILEKSTHEKRVLQSDIAPMIEKKHGR